MPIGALSRASDRSRCCGRMASPTARVLRWRRRRSNLMWLLVHGPGQLARRSVLLACRRRCRRRMPVRRRSFRRRLLIRHRTRGLQTRPRSPARRRQSRASARRFRVRARARQQRPQSLQRQVKVKTRLRSQHRPLPRLLLPRFRKRRLHLSVRVQARQWRRRLPLQQPLLPPKLQLQPQRPTLRRRLPKPSRVRQRRSFRSRRSNSQSGRGAIDTTIDSK